MTDEVESEEPAAGGVPLGLYVAVYAAIAEGFPLEVVLTHEELDPEAWRAADAAWSEKMMASAAGDMALVDAFDRRLIQAQELFRRRVAPLDDDLAAWTDFHRIWSNDPDPLAKLAELRLGRNDVIRLHRRWSDRMEADEALRKEAARLLEQPPGEIPALEIAPATLPPPFGFTIARPPPPAAKPDLAAAPSAPVEEEPAAEIPSLSVALPGESDEIAPPAPAPVEIRWGEAGAAEGQERAIHEDDVDATLEPEPVIRHYKGAVIPEMPFVPPAPGARSPMAIPSGSPSSPRRRGELGATLDAPRVSPFALPFAGQRLRVSAPEPSAPPADLPPTAPIPPVAVAPPEDATRSPSALPFTSAAPAPEQAAAPPAQPRPPAPREDLGQTTAAPRISPFALPFSAEKRHPSGQLPAVSPPAPHPSGQLPAVNPPPRHASGQLPAVNPPPLRPSGQLPAMNPPPRRPSGQLPAVNPPPQPPSAPPPAPAPPAAPMSPSLRLTLAQYAALCAELAAFPRSTEETFQRYGLADLRSRLTVDMAWQDRLRRNPGEYREWQTAYQQHLAFVTSRGPARS